MRVVLRKPALTAVAAASLCAVAFSPERVSSHPHAWIDIKVDVLFDDDGRAVGLREHWLFDEFYTAFALEGLGVAGRTEPSQEMLDEIVRLNVTNLADFNYFTDVLYGEDKVTFAEASDTIGSMQDQRLVMSFVVPFADGLDLSEQLLTYSVYDPTYYIEMLHAAIDAPIALEGAPEGCSHEVLAPNPTMEAISLATAIDRAPTTNDGLGALFAEQVVVQCD